MGQNSRITCFTICDVATPTSIGSPGSRPLRNHLNGNLNDDVRVTSAHVPWQRPFVQKTKCRPPLPSGKSFATC